MTKFNTAAAIAALNAWAGDASLAGDARNAATSGREAFATAVIAGAMEAGKAALDDIKADFDTMPKHVKDPIKGGVTETLSLVRWVIAGNVIPAGKTTPAVNCLADLAARTTPLSGYAKPWREAKGKSTAEASNVEREETRLMGLGLIALGCAAPMNASDCYRAMVAGVTDYAGHAIADIISAGEIASDEAEAAAKAEAGAKEAEAYEAGVIAYLAAMPSEALTALMEAVSEARTVEAVESIAA